MFGKLCFACLHSNYFLPLTTWWIFEARLGKINRAVLFVDLRRSKILAVEGEGKGPVPSDHIHLPTRFLDIRTSLHPSPTLILLTVGAVRVLDGVEALTSILIELFKMLSIKQRISCHLDTGYGQSCGKRETPYYPGFIQWSQGALLNCLACFVGVCQNEGKGEEAQA